MSILQKAAAAMNSQDVALTSEITTNVTMLRFTQIRTNGGTQMRAGFNEQTAGEYADELRRGVVFPPVVVFFDGADYWLGDGFHRVRAYFMAKGSEVEIPCEVRSGTRRNAILCAAQANADHGLRRTNADKRRAVETLLRDDEWGQWSNIKIAQMCRVSDRFVGTVRTELSADTPNRSESERTYTHPKTGQPTTMKIGNIGGVVGKCRKCGRLLTDSEHVANGCGPVCAAKLAAQGATHQEPDLAENDDVRAPEMPSSAPVVSKRRPGHGMDADELRQCLDALENAAGVLATMAEHCTKSRRTGEQDDLSLARQTLLAIIDRWEE